MRCPTLSQLPSPPDGKTGWPWTEENLQLPERMPDGSEWSRISIVTPNYNYGHFLEETIRSILLQGYPNLEYIVIDGGSTDNSLEIIKKYEPWLTYWVSERDKGQANAINKGLAKATGHIAAYLNSDDIYLAGSFQHIAKVFHYKKCDILVGKSKLDDLRPKYFLLRRSWWKSVFKPFLYPFIFEDYCRYELRQESIFWNHYKFHKLNFNDTYQFCLDVWWFTQIYSDAIVVHSSRKLGYFRIHSASKTSRIQDICQKEFERILLEVNAFSLPLTPKAKKKIISIYKRATIYANLVKVVVPFVDLTFKYHHPPYLNKQSQEIK